MNRRDLLAMAILLGGGGGLAVAAEPAGRADEGDYVDFPQAGVRLRQPRGFVKEEAFQGFGQPETKSSVMVVTLPGPFAEITAGFTAEQMTARGWKFLSKQDVQLDGSPAMLVNFEQPAGGEEFLKWSIVWGNEQQTTLITATMPKKLEAELSGRLKSVLLEAKLLRVARPQPGADLDFTLQPKKLKLARSPSKTLVYTKDRATTTESPADPLFIAARSLWQVEIADRRKYAEQRLQRTAQTKSVEVTSTHPIRIDGLDGYESLADAEDDDSDTPLVLYQVLLFDKGSYILMVGLVGAKHREEYLPEFKSLARSLKRKQP